jgi:hypothetical protein
MRLPLDNHIVHADKALTDRRALDRQLADVLAK